MTPAVTASPAPARTTVALGVLASLAFIALGLPDGLLGVAWPSIRASFALPLDALGALLVTFTTGYVAASSLGGRLVARLGLARLLTVSCAATALSLIGYAASPSWGLVVGLGAVAGLGAGGIDTGVNTYAATHHGPRMLNWLHACYGIGAALGPAIMTVVFAAHAAWRWGYAAVGVGLAVLALTFAASRRIWPSETVRMPTKASAISPHGGTQSASAARASRGVVLPLHGPRAGRRDVGVHAAHRGTRHVGDDRGQLGRLVLDRADRRPASARSALRADRIVDCLRGAMVLLTIGLTLLAAGLSRTTDLIGLLLSGFAAGPIFPTLIASTPARVGARHVANTVGLQIGAAGVGQALLPSALGVLADALGLDALAAALVALAHRRERQRTGGVELRADGRR